MKIENMNENAEWRAEKLFSVLSMSSRKLSSRKLILVPRIICIPGISSGENRNIFSS